jgi:DNA-binding NtrC family response regulator
MVEVALATQAVGLGTVGLHLLAFRMPLSRGEDSPRAGIVLSSAHSCEALPLYHKQHRSDTPGVAFASSRCMTDILRPIPAGGGHEAAAALLATSATVRAFQQALPSLARSDLNLIVCGEPGTGKRHWAQAIHDHSARHGRLFTTIRVSAFDEASLETKLFGGSGKDGALARARGGTVYLEDVEALTPRLQQRLTLWIASTDADVRLISGTSNTLPDEVRFGRFSRRLYNVLAVVQLSIPPLRDRPEDIPAIVEYCLTHVKSDEVVAIRDDALTELCHYRWPENTRELVQIVEAARAAAHGLPITGEVVRSVLGRRPLRNSALEIVPLYQLESEYIQIALARCEGNQSMAARRLGIGRSTLIRKLRAGGGRNYQAA